MYLIVSKNTQYGEESALGHEIHISRPVLIYLLTHQYINRHDIVVTSYKDRFFMYSNLFDNVIEYVNIPPNSDVVDLVSLYLWINWPYGGDINNVLQRFPVINDIKNNSVIVKGLEFMQNIWNIRYANIEHYVKKDFIIFHNRVLLKDDNNVKEQKESVLVAILNKVLECFPELNIIVFSVVDFNYNHLNVYNKITSLEEYASLMNHQLCKGVISEWSGCGQLAQQCHNRKIFYYPNTYSLDHYCNSKDEILNIAGDIYNIFNAWDFKIYSNATIYLYRDLHHILTCFANDFP